MELSDFSRAVKRRWWIIVAALVVGLAFGYVANVTTQPVYRSSVGFFVVAPTAARLSALEADNLVRGRITTYASLVTSDRFLEQIVTATGDRVTKADAASSVTAFGDPSTLLLNVNVDNADPKLSLAMASAVASQFGVMVNRLEGRSQTQDSETVLNVVSGPSLLAAPVSPRKSLNLGIGGIIGLAIGLALVIALQRGDRTIRREEQMGVDLPVLAIMPKDHVANKPAHLMLPHANSVLDEAARRLRTSIQYHPRSQELQLLAVTAARKGDGTTTTAFVLAKAVSETEKRVLLVEANLRMPDIAARLELASEPGLVDVLTGSSGMSAAIQKTANDKLDVLVAGKSTERPSELLGSGISELLQELRSLYDVIVIDTAALATWTDAALVAAAADGTIVVARHGRTTHAMLETAQQSLSSVRADVLGLVLNAQPIKRAHGHEVLTGSHVRDAAVQDASPSAPGDVPKDGGTVHGTQTTVAGADAKTVGAVVKRRKSETQI